MAEASTYELKHQAGVTSALRVVDLSRVLAGPVQEGLEELRDFSAREISNLATKGVI